jgi:epsilon-lactone hydrolase
MRDEDGVMQVAAFDLPQSSFLAIEVRDALRRWRNSMAELQQASALHGNDRDRIVAYRGFMDEHFYRPVIARLRSLYRVHVRAETCGDVHAEVITPPDGISPGNDGCVLLNLHGGGFTIGGRYGGLIESIPIAALHRIKVVTVDYRMAPEHRFPAATDDAVAVYRHLLKTHEPEHIGIYGCSAGALLTTQAVVRLQEGQVPLPAAIGLFCGGGSYWTDGDTGHFGAALGHTSLESASDHPYFKGTLMSDPLAFPVRSRQPMAAFPPSLLITATRDPALSSVVHTHSCLVRQAVQADLHVWEGLGHAFFFDPDLPPSREMWGITAAFFARHLGRARADRHS